MTKFEEMLLLRVNLYGEDLGAKLTWLLAAAAFHFDADVLGYGLLGMGGLEMISALRVLHKIRAAEEEEPKP